MVWYCDAVDQAKAKPKLDLSLFWVILAEACQGQCQLVLDDLLAKWRVSSRELAGIQIHKNDAKKTFSKDLVDRLADLSIKQLKDLPSESDVSDLVFRQRINKLL